MAYRPFRCYPFASVVFDANCGSLLWVTTAGQLVRTANKLTAMRVQKARKKGLYGDGNGLWLQVGRCGTKSWLLRYMLNGKPRYMGLGAVHSVSLLEARERARQARSLLAMGEDPLASKKAVARSLSLTFDLCAARFLDAHASTWKNPKHRAQWKSTLATYASPILGSLPVSAVDTAEVMQVLEPIWRKIPETARRVRCRIERVLNWAAVQKFRSGENPARWRGHLDMLLSAKDKAKAADAHHAALAYDALPAFMSKLEKRNSASARALEFTILTAARTGEVIGAQWDEIDLKAKLWTVPAGRMKSGSAHRVPLSDRVVSLLQALPRHGSGVVFPGATGKPLSNMSMLMLLRGMQPGLTVHGFRSTFSDWARDRTRYPRDVVEAALAHAVEDKTEAAYRRGDSLEKRRCLMADWASFASGAFIDGEVVQFGEVARA
jgi:integrase